MHVHKNYNLKSYNTFGLDAKATFFVDATTEKELKEALNLGIHPKLFILGGGSNILLTQDLDALAVHVNNKGKTIISETNDEVIVKVNAGENWHEFVLWCIDNSYGGVENMSLIPGNVGTAPIQNIGAYGVELKDVFVSCETIEIETGYNRTFTKEQCHFGYRNSIFKQDQKGKHVIINVTFRLTKNNHKFKTSYGTISSELEKQNITTPNIKDVSDAVIAIRSSKLPDPKEIGNSGSFFKNPIIDINHYQLLQSNFPEIPSYPVSEEEVKVPAGWLIEKAGFKGKTFGNYGVHKNQALVLVNYGGANGKDILELSKIIQNTIRTLFDINLEAEVNII
ncbi:MAG: UDP-N-acetylmuramate dehydrogenase [Bacteroidia bacterium]|nr:UDP-N-acetylmuramate dehydrogenase [Bacteroidia bacterium]